MRFSRKKIEGFVLEVHKEHQVYQTTVTDLLERYSEKIVATEKVIAKLPDTLAVQMEEVHKKYLGDLNSVGTSHIQALNDAMEQHIGKMNATTEIIAKVPIELDTHLQKDRAQNIIDLKTVQEQYAAELAKINNTFSEQLQTVVENIQMVPGQIKADSDQQYSAFLKDLEKMMDARLAQLSNTEKQVVELSQQLEAKYNAFVTKLEATNMDQLYKYCQDMNKSINTKLSIVLGGVAVAVIVSISSLFI